MYDNGTSILAGRNTTGASASYMDRVHMVICKHAPRDTAGFEGFRTFLSLPFCETPSWCDDPACVDETAAVLCLRRYALERAETGLATCSGWCNRNIVQVDALVNLRSKEEEFPRSLSPTRNFGRRDADAQLPCSLFACFS